MNLEVEIIAGKILEEEITTAITAAVITEEIIVITATGVEEEIIAITGIKILKSDLSKYLQANALQLAGIFL